MDCAFAELLAVSRKCVDDFIAEDNSVRVVDAFVDELDFQELGFEGIRSACTGRPRYHPAVLLKIYIYGYLNRIQSSGATAARAAAPGDHCRVTVNVRPSRKLPSIVLSSTFFIFRV
ncbi:Transposase domain [Variovorax sp. YR216]|nr:Transposase domain [Variovorax sp. YR216]